MGKADDVQDPLLCGLSLQVDQDWPCDEMDITKGEVFCQETKTTGSTKPTALETCVRYMAAELNPKMIRVNSLSPGPISTRAASGIGHFEALMKPAVNHLP